MKYNFTASWVKNRPAYWINGIRVSKKKDMNILLLKIAHYPNSFMRGIKNTINKENPMKQTKLSSLLESFTNIAIGYFVALLSQLVIFPQFGINVSLETNLLIGAWFTLVSLVRSYVIRRYFNNRLFFNKSQAVVTVSKVVSK